MNSGVGALDEGADGAAAASVSKPNFTVRGKDYTVRPRPNVFSSCLGPSRVATTLPGGGVLGTTSGGGVERSLAGGTGRKARDAATALRPPTCPRPRSPLPVRPAFRSRAPTRGDHDLESVCGRTPSPFGRSAAGAPPARRTGVFPPGRRRPAIVSRARKGRRHSVGTREALLSLCHDPAPWRRRQRCARSPLVVCPERRRTPVDPRSPHHAPSSLALAPTPAPPSASSSPRAARPPAGANGPATTVCEQVAALPRHGEWPPKNDGEPRGQQALRHDDPDRDHPERHRDGDDGLLDR